MNHKVLTLFLLLWTPIFAQALDYKDCTEYGGNLQCMPAEEGDWEYVGFNGTRQSKLIFKEIPDKETIKTLAKEIYPDKYGHWNSKKYLKYSYPVFNNDSLDRRYWRLKSTSSGYGDRDDNDPIIIGRYRWDSPVLLDHYALQDNTLMMRWDYSIITIAFMTLLVVAMWRMILLV